MPAAGRSWRVNGFNGKYHTAGMMSPDIRMLSSSRTARHIPYLLTVGYKVEM